MTCSTVHRLPFISGAVSSPELILNLTITAHPYKMVHFRVVQQVILDEGVIKHLKLIHNAVEMKMIKYFSRMI